MNPYCSVYMYIHVHVHVHVYIVVLDMLVGGIHVRVHTVCMGWWLSDMLSCRVRCTLATSPLPTHCWRWLACSTTTSQLQTSFTPRPKCWHIRSPHCGTTFWKSKLPTAPITFASIISAHIWLMLPNLSPSPNLQYMYMYCTYTKYRVFTITM